MTDCSTHMMEIISGRRSVRAFLPDAISRETVEAILAAASRSASGGNSQPWHVYAVTAEPQGRLADAIKTHINAGMPRPELEYSYESTNREPYVARRRAVGFALYDALKIEKTDIKARQKQLERNYRFFDAPLELIFTLDRDIGVGPFMELGMFMQSIALAARALGLETCFQAALANYHAIMREQFSIPDIELVVCGMAIGYEDRSRPENKLQTPREAVSDFTRFFGFLDDAG